MRSMAVACPTSPQIILWDSSRIMKPVGWVTMLARNQVLVNRATAVRTRSSLKNQVPKVNFYVDPFRFRRETCTALVLLGDYSVTVTGRFAVFEDQREGIVCYVDESGEIICEGYDEGPRFRRKIPRAAYSYEARDADIIDLLQRNWLQIAEDGALYKVQVGDILQEDLT